VLGQANRPSRIVYIFFHRILPVAIKYRQNYARVLGLVMAHEMGHILFPADSHSATGIMSAHPDVWSKSVRYFTAKQGELIRSMLIRESQTGSPNDPAREPRTQKMNTEPTMNTN
jgi:hypothetical protein